MISGIPYQAYVNKAQGSIDEPTQTNPPSQPPPFRPLSSGASTQMIESNAVLYLGEEMMGLHQEALESFRDIGNEEGAVNISGSGDTGGESPNAKKLSDSGVGDARPRAINAFSSQVRFILSLRGAGLAEWAVARGRHESAYRVVSTLVPKQRSFVVARKNSRLDASRFAAIFRCP